MFRKQEQKPESRNLEAKLGGRTWDNLGDGYGSEKKDL
jgi:hypothetical protein